MALTRPTQKQFTSDIVRFDDPVFAANYAHTGTNVNDVGFIFNRGSDINVGFIWDESADEFAAITTTDTGDTTGNIAISSYATFKVGQIVANGIAFPASDGTAGQVLITNGSGTLSFTDQSGAAGGSNAQVQFNDTGALGGSANLTFDGTTLTVSGALAVDNVSIDGNQISASAGNLSITSTGSVTLLTDGSERMHIDSSGNVGIGTSSPAQILHVRGSGAAARIDNSDAGANVYGDILSETGGLFTLRSRGGASTHGSIDFRTWNGTDDLSRMRITSDGHLHLSGNLRLGDVADILSSTTGAGSIAISAGTTYNSGGTIVYRGSSNAINPYGLEFNTGGSERMRINSSGDVGIGISPSFALDVYRSSTTTSIVVARNDTSTTAMYATSSASFAGTTTNTPFGFITNNAERMRIDSSGNVAIGTTSIPGSCKFRVSGSDAAAIGLVNGASYGVRFGSASGVGGYVEAVDAGGVTSYQPLVVGGSELRLATNNTERMRIDSSGNVGIGTTSPAAQLHVANAGGNSTSILGQFGSGTRAEVTAASNEVVIKAYNGTNDVMTFYTGASERMRIDSSGHVTPGANNAQDLGTSSLRWRNIYTNDLHLSNGIGDYTIVEGEEDLFLYNNKTGKVFKFALIEVDPNDAVKKANTK